MDSGTSPGRRKPAQAQTPEMRFSYPCIKRDKQIVVDADADKLAALKQSGKNRVPVTFYFNQKHQSPISEFGGEVTLESLLDEFFSSGQELTMVPLWQVGDYHLNVPPGELVDIFDIPQVQDLDPAQYKMAVNEIRRDGFSQSPALITLLQTDNFKALAEPERVRAAMELGVSDIPVVLFYHRLNRQSCSAPTSCFKQISQARQCASTSIAGTGYGIPVPAGSAGGGTEFVPPPPPLPPMLPGSSTPPSATATATAG